MRVHILSLFLIIFIVGTSSSPNISAESIFENVRSGTNIYQNQDYDFAISYPDNWIYQENVGVLNIEGDSESGLVGFFEVSSSKYPSNFMIDYISFSSTAMSEVFLLSDEELQDEMTNELLDLDNFRMTDFVTERYDDGLIINWIYTHSTELSSLTELQQDEGVYVTLKRNSIQYLLQDGSMFSLNFSALSDEFSSTHNDFKESVESFVVGKDIKLTKSEPETKFIPSTQEVTKLGIASFVDQTKDPQHYINRYNNEPKYKVWFDENYPQYISIYEAVGLSEPVVTQTNEAEYTPEPEMETEPESVSKETKTETKEFGDDYYVDEGFGFAIKIPKGATIDDEAITVLDGRALVAFHFGGNEDFLSGYNIHYYHDDPDLINYDDLLYYFSETPQNAGGEYTQQIKVINEEIEEQDDRYKITYEYNTKDHYPEDYFYSDMAGKTITDGNKIVIFLYPNGDWYGINFSSDVSSYSTDVRIFDSVVDTFYVGNVKKISSNTGNSNSQTSDSSSGGGCLIATATYGTELAPQVQLLREIRDSKLSQTESGTAFMSTFNSFYYSFSPTIADWERESPVFKEAVKLAITPMIISLSLMDYAETESDVIGIGISLIILNLGMYVGIPVFVIIGIRRFQ